MTTPDLRLGRLAVSVVIPVKWSGGPEELYRVEEMARYLAGLRHTVDEVVVVDGSAAPARLQHEEAWGAFATLLEPEESGAGTGPGRKCWPNGKVVGALTGIRAAANELVVLADDDVRHTPSSIAALVETLQDADLVRPVNVFDSWPWHARWDGARTLLNVVLASDWPGTFGLRRSTVLHCGGWSADVLFENLELWRTVEAVGGRAVGRTDVVVWRRPPTAGQFWSQRVRQAYDDLAQPLRLVAELAVLPAVLLAGRRGPRLAGLLALAAVGLAEHGRRRIGVHRIPPSVPLWAPVWVLERSVCVWLAVGHRARGGVRYHGRRLGVAAHSARELRDRLAVH
ncbi:glycosyltransferase family 2 protein [Terrabacter sp. NPDC080008]|uniref:glycosyltransferase n=1 Tax=Terrabacter sp. NPDC080008 TaxID=3155176 RepID=UPI00344DC6B6